MSSTKVSFKIGEKNEFKDNDSEVVIQLKEDLKDGRELSDFLTKKLSKITNATIDYESYDKLNLKNVDKFSKDLIIYSIKSKVTHTAFSMKKKSSEEEKSEWKINDPDIKIKNLIDAYNEVKRLQLTPPNLLNTKEFVEESKKLLSGIENIKITEIKDEDLQKENLKLIENVGKGSENKPRLLIVEYKPSEGSFKALIGKGVCYDSGGLSIKTGPYMRNMKFDMSGGAVSLGVIYSMAKNKSKQNLVVSIPLVENSVNSNSYRPDDIVISRSGKSIEIDNTDAEGRLVLADAISYTIDKYEPEEIITIATLTGAIGYALGNKYGGAWSTSCDRWNKLKSASKMAGEWIWRMPFDDYYLKALETKVADIKNSAKTGAGGASRAACFLKEFTNEIPYIHLDIANIANCDETGEAKAPLLRTLYLYLNNK